MVGAIGYSGSPPPCIRPCTDTNTCIHTRRKMMITLIPISMIHGGGGGGSYCLIRRPQKSSNKGEGGRGFNRYFVIAFSKKLSTFLSNILTFANFLFLLVYLSVKIHLKTLLFCICNSSWKYISMFVNFYLFKSGDTLSFLCFIFRSFSFLFKYTFSLYFLYFYFEQYS